MILKNGVGYLVLLLALVGVKNAGGQIVFNTYIDRPIDANYSGHISDVEITFDGGYVTVSGSSSLNISKFSSTGSLSWSTDAAWGGGIYYARNVVQLKDSGFAVTGTGGPGYDPSSTWQIAFMRLDKNGNLLWLESFNGSSNSFDMGSHILQTLDGGLLVVGQYNSEGILIKTDINGNQQWANTYSAVTRMRTAFQNTDSSYTVWSVSDNNSGFFVAKMEIDKNGNVLGSKSYNIGFFTQYLSVKPTADKGFIVQMDQYGTSPILMKTDSTDNVTWTKLYTIGSNSNNSRDPRDVQPVDGGYVFTGENFTDPAGNTGFSTAFWAKTDYSGNVLWVRDYQTAYWGVAYSAKETADKGLVLWTSMFTNGSTIVGDLIKTDSLGNSTCVLYKDTATSAPLTLTPSSLTVTSSPITGVIVQTNSYTGPVAAAGSPCVAAPVAGFSANPLTVCMGSTVNFTDQSSGSPTSWAWTFAGGSPGSSNLQNPSVTYDTAGVYDVKLVATNSNGGNTIVKMGYITVTSLPVVTVSPQDTAVCAGSSVSLTASGASGYTWRPSIGLNDSTEAVVVATPGNTITYTVTGNNVGCSDTTSLSITINQLPTPVVTASDSLICPSDSALVQTSPAYSTYLWNDADTVYYTNAKAAGGYWVTATDANGCSAVSNHVNIGVYPAPSVSIVVRGDTLSSFNSSLYQWYKDGEPISNATSPTYIAGDSGYYSVQVTDTNGCKAVSTPVFVTTTGISAIGWNEGVIVYPNPFDNFILIQLPDLNTKIEQVHIYDIPGRLVLNRSPVNTGSISSVDVSQLLPGMYFINIKTGGIEYVFKMIKN